jgi:hypothetical protein
VLFFFLSFDIEREVVGELKKEDCNDGGSNILEQGDNEVLHIARSPVVRAGELDKHREIKKGGPEEYPGQ